MRPSLYFAPLAVAVACTRTSSPPPAVPLPALVEPANETATQVDDDVDELEDEGLAAPMVSASERTTLVGPAPTIRVVQPAQGALIQKSPVKLVIKVANWPLDAPRGRHIHVQVDDGEEIAVRDLSKPLFLDELYEARFGEPLPEGTHLLRVFLSRPNHESVKLRTAMSMVVFHYKKRSGKFDFDPLQPLLTYSRPQGCSQDAARLLDFQLINLNALSSRGYRVEYEIDGVHRGALLDWRPYRIEGLADGTHTIQLTLIRPDGKRAPGRFNQITRTIGTGSACPEGGIIPDATAEEDEESLLEDPAPKITNPRAKPKR